MHTVQYLIFHGEHEFLTVGLGHDFRQQVEEMIIRSRSIQFLILKGINFSSEMRAAQQHHFSNGALFVILFDNVL